jgi:Uma2 family endonuclease
VTFKPWTVSFSIVNLGSCRQFLKDALLSEEDYLRSEELSDVKHEFVAGVAHAMTGAGLEHNTIAANIVIALGSRLRGKPRQPFASDLKIRVQADGHVHPDAMVVCDRTGLAPKRHWTDKPAVIFEVLSDSTRRIDEGEKALLYWKLPSLVSYVLVEQDKVQVTVRKRDGGGEVLSGDDTMLRLPELGIEIPLAEFYELAVVIISPEACVPAGTTFRAAPRSSTSRESTTARTSASASRSTAALPPQSRVDPVQPPR